jgi:hypothetical protein
VISSEDSASAEVNLNLTPSSLRAGAASTEPCDVSQTPCQGSLMVSSPSGPLDVGTVAIAGVYKVAEDTLQVTVDFTTTNGRSMLFSSVQWALCSNAAGAVCDCTTLEYPLAQ